MDFGAEPYNILIKMKDISYFVGKKAIEIAAKYLNSRMVLYDKDMQYDVESTYLKEVHDYLNKKKA